MIQNLDTNSPLLTNWQGVIAERLSEREIRFTIRTPYAFFIDNLRMLRPIPKHIFESVPPANLRLSTYNLEPIGSGPYQFSRYEKQKTGFLSSYVLELNHNFAGTKPHIQTIRLVFYQTYKDALTAFNTKEIDGLGGLDPAQLPDLRVVHQIFELNIPRYYAVFFNQTVQPILKDVAVRQALELATDKEEIIKAVFDNHALIVNGPLLPYIEEYDAARYASDTLSLDLASSTLNKAGWKLGDDGIRTKTVNKVVQRLSFEIVVPQIPFLVNTANLLKAQWEKVGIELTPIVLTPQDVANNAIKTRSYQMLLFGNILRGNPDIFSFWHSSQRFSPGLNLSLYENKSVDALLESLRKDSKKESRQQSLAKIQKSIADDQPAIFLYSPTYLYAGPKDLGGFGAPFITSPAERLRNIESWYLETTRVFK
jgi:peptide/nickel transport system substrate-binding protein